MKKLLIATLILATSAYALADAPSLVGTWSLANMVCSSGTPMKGGLKIGQDSMQAIYGADKSVQYTSRVAGCSVEAIGTYKYENNILNTVMTESQSCKEDDPVPMNEFESFYVAHLSDKEMVAVVTGKNASMVCPVYDALIFSFNRI